jgi:hypothetical protein
VKPGRLATLWPLLLMAAWLAYRLMMTMMKLPPMIVMMFEWA